MRATCAAAETGHIHPDVTRLVDLLGRHGLDLRDLATEGTNDGYGAATAHCRDSVVRLRVGRTTPKKPGHFVAAWRRDLDDRPVPLDDGDGTAALIVIARRDPDAGVFVLTRPKMQALGISVVGGVGGKNGFRVYPSWAVHDSASGRRSQIAQADDFFDLSDDREASTAGLATALALL